MLNRGRGHRWMYYATGLPGRMRFGFSPGWYGMGPYGASPGADYFMTGQWPTPQAQAYWQAMQAEQAPSPFYGQEFGAMTFGSPAFPGRGPGPQMSREQELDFLRNQAEAIRGQLEQIDARMREMESEE